MCTTKSPKIVTPEAQKRDPVYMRNMYLDGLGINAEQRGRNSLRIDRTGASGSAWSDLASRQMTQIKVPVRTPVTGVPVTQPRQLPTNLGIAG